MKSVLCGVLTAAFLTSVALPGYAQTGAIVEGRSPQNYVPPSGGNPYLPNSSNRYYDPGPVVIDTTPPPSGPAFENASPYPPCAFCSTAPDPTENPAGDASTYREMNPDTDPVGRTEAEPMAPDD
jgi:hypothetical protein